MFALGTLPVSGEPDGVLSSGYVLAEVDRGDVVKRWCQVEEGASGSTSFLALQTISSPSGDHAAAFTSGSASHEVFVRAAAGPQGAQLVALPNGSSSPSEDFLRMDVLHDQSTLRSAWAGWGVQIACRVEVNGEQLTTQPRSYQGYERVYASDFRGGAALESSPTGSMSLSQRHDWQSTGFMAAVMDGVTRVDGPEFKEPIEGRLIVSDTPGAWSFTYDLRYREHASPVLYLVELGG